MRQRHEHRLHEVEIQLVHIRDRPDGIRVDVLLVPERLHDARHAHVLLLAVRCSLVA